MDHVQVFPDGELNVQAAASRDTSPSFTRPCPPPLQQRARQMQAASKLQNPSRYGTPSSSPLTKTGLLYAAQTQGEEYSLPT